ncbi:MAG: hypothetical protein AAF479_10945 [Pseudomonadota bacterium]
MTEPSNTEMANNAHKNAYEAANKSNLAQIENANIALKSIFLLNGGAAVAMIAFLGSAVGTDNLPDGIRLSLVFAPIVYFGWGVALAAIATVIAYSANSCITRSLYGYDLDWTHPYVHENDESRLYKKWGEGLIVIGFLTVLASIALFTIGVYEVRAVVIHELP